MATRTKPQKIPCPSGCDRGYHYFMGNTQCHTCHGIGRNLKSNLWALPCRICNGRGTIPRPRERCGTCGERGFILTS